MNIKQVLCRNFRNIENCRVTLDEGINVITGNNGQGKTNFLESIYYLSTTRSFRISKDQELIMHEKPLARIECWLNDEEIERHLFCVIHDKGKSCFISNRQIPRTSEFIGKLNAILFAPSDLEMFTASPRYRRRLMDVEIGKLNSSYSHALNRYNRLMKERNASLKLEKMDLDFLDVVERQMAEAEMTILQKRRQFVDFLNQRLTERYCRLSEENAAIFCRYETFVDFSELTLETLIEKRKASRQKDWILKSTSVGIHRDDLVFWMDDLPLDSVASQGQRRMTVLSLKMAFIDYGIEFSEKKPVLLLDDVLSELDIQKRRNLFQTIPSKLQTLITTTDLNDVLEELPSRPKIMRMEKGRLIE